VYKRQIQERKLTEKIQQLPGVKNATLIPKNVGLRQMRDEWGPGGDQLFKDLDGEGQNPLPDIITVEPKDPNNVESLKKQIENFGSDKIERVEAGEGVTDKLLNFSSWVRNIVLIFGLGLAVLAAFLISNTIKLTIIARKREIEIQRLVGASNWFIRWPFFIEGAFIGVVGAIFPIVIVLTIYQVFFNVLGAGDAAAILKLMPVVSLGIYVALSIFALGVAIGTIGSIISVRRFLKV
jgi:cell division transport system permease protein